MVEHKLYRSQLSYLQFVDFCTFTIKANSYTPKMEIHSLQDENYAAMLQKD